MFSTNYKSSVKSSYNEVLSAVDDFLTNGIQALQHWWKMCVDVEN